LVSFDDLRKMQENERKNLNDIKVENSNEKNMFKQSFVGIFKDFQNHLGLYFSILALGLDIFEFNNFVKMTDKWETIYSSNNSGKRIAIYWPKNPEELLSTENLMYLINYVTETLFNIQTKGIGLKISEDQKDFLDIISNWDLTRITIHEI
jgi:hypothetical protein